MGQQWTDQGENGIMVTLIISLCALCREYNITEAEFRFTSLNHSSCQSYIQGKPPTAVEFIYFLEARGNLTEELVTINNRILEQHCFCNLKLKIGK